MSNILKYSVLRYSPSILGGESINLGILFYCEKENARRFISTTKWTRIREFDDELNISDLKLILDSIRDQVEITLLNAQKTFSIESFIKYYTNELHFSKPICIDSNDIDKEIEEVKRMYLRYDYDKSNRPSKAEELRFIAQILNSQGVKFQRRGISIGTYHEPVVYDYLTSSYGIKLFQFQNKDLKKMMNDVKAWAWNSEKNKQVQTLIVYSSDLESENESNSANEDLLRTILRIFESSSTKVYRMDDMPKVFELLNKERSSYDDSPIMQN